MRQTRDFISTIAVLGTFCLFLTSGNARRSESTAQLVTIEGRVLDRSDSTAVGQASVLFREVKMGAITDTAGSFLVRSLPAGTYTVEVSSVTYATQSRQMTIPAAPDTARLYFYLDRKQYDHYGHPIDPGDTLGNPTGIIPQ